MKERVSQRDLAKLAGVSPMTVSLALRGHPSISQATRERIVALARRHGYHADPVLAALNKYRVHNAARQFQGTLGWLTFFPSASGWRNMVQTEGYFTGAAERARELGYSLEEIWMAEPGLSGSRASHILLSRGIQGLVVSPLPSAHGEVVLDWKCFSAVALGYSLSKPQLHVVMNHQFRNMKHTVRRLYDLGYRRIGLAMPFASDERVDHNYLGGYMVAHYELRLTAQPSPLLVDHISADGFLAWFRAEQPDAVILSATLVREIMGWLESEGLNIPGDIGIAVPNIPDGDRSITGIDEDARKIGAMAVNTVVGMLHRNERGEPKKPWSVLAEGLWNPGRTARKVMERNR